MTDDPDSPPDAPVFPSSASIPSPEQAWIDEERKTPPYFSDPGDRAYHYAGALLNYAEQYRDATGALPEGRDLAALADRAHREAEGSDLAGRTAEADATADSSAPAPQGVTYQPRAGDLPDDATQQATTCMAGCLDTPLIVTGAKESSSHKPGSAHATGQAVDLGLGANPTLQERRQDIEGCFKQCFPPNSMGQYEANPPHYHLQTKPGGGGLTGFRPGNH